MRINVYSQELTDEVQFVFKETEGRIYCGIRFTLASPERLHHTEDDDDRSAVTFWAADDNRTWDRLALAELMDRAAELLRHSYVTDAGDGLGVMVG